MSQTRPFHLAAPALLLLSTTSGCVSWQSVRLPTTPQREDQLSRVVIEDARPAEEKRTLVIKEWSGECARVYGDGFIEHTKIEYLRNLLAERLAPSSTLVIRLERFDTIERCERSMSRSTRAARVGAIAGATGGRVWVTGGREPPGLRDDFALQLVGTANGAPFRYRGVFDYSDLRVYNFPSGNAEYPVRIERLFREFVELLRSPDERSMTPEIEIVNPRIREPAPARAEHPRTPNP